MLYQVCDEIENLWFSVQSILGAENTRKCCSANVGKKRQRLHSRRQSNARQNVEVMIVYDVATRRNVGVVVVYDVATRQNVGVMVVYDAATRWRSYDSL